MSAIMRARMAIDIERKDLTDCFDENIIKGELYNDRIFKICFGEERPEKQHSILRKQYGSKRCAEMQKLLARARPESIQAFCTLQAFGITDDFYGNTLDISKERMIAIGLKNDVVLRARDGTTTCAPFDERSPLCAVKWLPDGTQFFTGFSDSHMSIVDAATTSSIYTEHSYRSWISVASTATSIYMGSVTGIVQQMDLRAPKVKEDVGGHAGAVCGLAIDSEGTKLASGGNDNAVKIWDLRRLTMPVAEFYCHTSAVKALSWAPWDHNLLFSGGGLEDKTVSALSISKQKCIATTGPTAQVTGLHASKSDTEVISCHGYQQNNAVIWKFQGEKARFIPITKLEGHTERLLHSTLSHDNAELVTASADETIRIWEVFEKMKKLKVSDEPFVNATNSVLR